MTLPSSATRSRTGSGERARTLPRTALRTLAASVFAALCLTGLAAPPASARQSPPTDTALAWGSNYTGELGNGTESGNDPNPTPVDVDLPAGVKLTDVSGGHQFSLGLSSDGHVYAWGFNSSGQLGDGTTTTRTSPVEVHLPAGTRATAISAGTNHSLAVTSDGHVYAWGWNDSGQLGIGTADNDPHPTPAEALLPAGVQATAIAAGRYHSLAVTSDGRVFAWGYNYWGQLGNGTTGVDPNPTPVETDLPAGTEATAVAAGDSHSLALTSDGRVLAWGADYNGQLGDGMYNFFPTPTPVETLLPAGTRVTAIDAATSGNHSLAVTSDGHALGWGADSSGQLGDGTTTASRATPIEPDLPAGTRVTAVAAGAHHSMWLASTGVIYTSGDNSSGQLGDGTTTNRSVPGPVNLPAGIHATAISAGAWHSLALAAEAESTTTLTASPMVSRLGEEVTFTAHVTCDVGTPTGNVVFYDGSDPIGTGTLDASGDATLTTTSLPSGNSTITAHYEGDGTCPASVSEPVTVTVLAPEPGAALGLTKEAVSTGPFEAGDTVEYTYTVTNTGGITLSPVTVADDLVADVDCDATVLAPGEHTTCHGSYVVTEADATCGPRGSGNGGRRDGGYGGGHGGTCPVTNSAIASALGVEGETITSNTATATIQVSNGNGGHDGYGSGGYGHGSDYGNGNGRKKEAKAA
ncbi:Ig-like domain repeat protein [Streptomyces sp. NPDC046203]|uniref:RCC1 domain-containing protein n=1 Tax=Streptomyces sp. NPDC046203 TaxID=3154602 RepID=UPI0033EA5A14